MQARGWRTNLAVIIDEASLTRLRDHELSLRVQIATSHDLALLALLLIVKHVVHLVVDHVVAELFSLGTAEFSTDASVDRSTCSLTFTTKVTSFWCINQTWLVAILDWTSIANGSRALPWLEHLIINANKLEGRRTYLIITCRQVCDGLNSNRLLVFTLFHDTLSVVHRMLWIPTSLIFAFVWLERVVEWCKYFWVFDLRKVQVFLTQICILCEWHFLQLYRVIRTCKLTWILWVDWQLFITCLPWI